MGSEGGKQRSPKFKRTVVLEVLKGDKSEAEIALVKVFFSAS